MRFCFYFTTLSSSHWLCFLSPFSSHMLSVLFVLLQLPILVYCACHYHLCTRPPQAWEYLFRYFIWLSCLFSCWGMLSRFEGLIWAASMMGLQIPCLVVSIMPPLHSCTEFDSVLYQKGLWCQKNFNAALYWRRYFCSHCGGTNYGLHLLQCFIYSLQLLL